MKNAGVDLIRMQMVDDVEAGFAQRIEVHEVVVIEDEIVNAGMEEQKAEAGMARVGLGMPAGIGELQGEQAMGIERGVHLDGTIDSLAVGGGFVTPPGVTAPERRKQNEKCYGHGDAAASSARRSRRGSGTSFASRTDAPVMATRPPIRNTPRTLSMRPMPRCIFVVVKAMEGTGKIQNALALIADGGNAYLPRAWRHHPEAAGEELNNPVWIA